MGILQNTFNLLVIYAFLVGVSKGVPNGEESCGSVSECEAEAKKYLEQSYEPEASAFYNKAAIGEWNYVTNLTSKEAEEAATESAIAAAKFGFKAWNDTIRHWNYTTFKDERLKRQLKFLNVIGVAALNSTDLEEYNVVTGEMEKTYGTAIICPFNNQNCDITSEGLNLEPDIEHIISTSRNSEELAYTWKAWRDAAGKPIRELYNEYIDLANRAAQSNGFNDTSDLWLFNYESDNFKQEMETLWNDVKGLYEKLYGYVRYRLRQWYPHQFKNEDDPIPAHILGNMWAQQWDYIYDIVKPYPSVTGFDVTEALQKKFGSDGKAAVTEMFKLANKFFMDLGLADMSVAFGEKAVIVKPNDREVVCHASAWDFSDGKDYRIKMCTKVEQDDLLTVHHELGHISYYMQYRDLPITFREGGNPGFHEAIGDTIALSVATTKHMIKLGLMNDTESSEELTINYLMSKALEKIAFLPFGYLIDAYRWQLFDGSLPRENMTYGWWKIRNEVQGIIPPVLRTEQDFDAGAKYHVPGDSPYISYFVSFIIQFQIHKALCLKAGEYVPNDPKHPLHNCDIDGNAAAGAVMKELLQAGSSANWHEIFEKATGTREMNASAIKEYFAPLVQYLDKQQEQFKYSTTWRKDAWMELYKKQDNGTGSDSEKEAKEYLEKSFEKEASQFCNKAVVGDWNYKTNLTSKEAEEEATKTAIAAANFNFKAWNDTIRHWDYETFKDEGLKRQLKFLNVVGVAILNSTDLEEYSSVTSKMEKTYGTAKICPFNKQNCNIATEGLNLEPEISQIISTSRNSEELAYTWKAWRDAAGKPIRDLYKEYIDLGNKAAEANGFNDTSDLWLIQYESGNFKQQMQTLWNDVKELYEKLYGFVRYRLRKCYPNEFKNEDDPIPAHILGNMWGQQWNNIYDLVKPYPNVTGFDVTEALQKKFGSDGKESVTEIFKLANKFFMDLGLADMSVAFGEKAVIVKPNDREVVCHASAWDFCDGKDYRIKMCTKVDHDHLLVVHHELGHIQYFMQYRDQPIIFRQGGNPGFHEAIGDTIALSVATTKHMAKLGLMNASESSREFTLNYLMSKALEKIAFLPFGYLIDDYRWQLFDGSLSTENMTAGWWKIRNEVQGMIPPVLRTEQDFDAGAKYHVPGNSPYISYFVSFIIQFQFHKALCIKAGEYVPNDPKHPLHNCDIDGNAAAGAVMKELLQAGASANWQNIFEKATGTREMDVSAIKEYFAPLVQYLDEQQKEFKYSTTWKKDAWMERYQKG